VRNRAGPHFGTQRHIRRHKHLCRQGFCSGLMSTVVYADSNGSRHQWGETENDRGRLHPDAFTRPSGTTSNMVLYLNLNGPSRRCFSCRRIICTIVEINASFGFGMVLAASWVSTLFPVSETDVHGRLKRVFGLESFLVWTLRKYNLTSFFPFVRYYRYSIGPVFWTRACCYGNIGPNTSGQCPKIRANDIVILMFECTRANM
jgi:hypothetical protein